MSRRVLVVLVGLPLVALAVGAALAYWPASLPPQLPEPREPILPDLAMSPLVDVTAGVADDGDQYVRFTAAIGNVGPGPFVVHAVRTDERGDWRVSQRFRERSGPSSELETPADLVYGGHGHSHWHVELGASYWITRPGSSEVLRRYEKVGFCFFDQSLLVRRPPGASPVPTFGREDCADHSTLVLEMGLSDGWSDPYQWTLPDQRLLVSGLDDGVYRLWATADPGGWFREARADNNVTWIDVRLTLSTRPPGVEVVRRGPAGASSWVAR